ncbi:MAG: O-antigen ligase family protein [Salinibacterium sp.]|nr:O-antigen ligase family protein [Salinibacterium sp.]
MNTPPGRPSLTAVAAEFLGSARLTRAITLTTLGTAVLSFAIRSTMGWPGLIAILAALVVLAALSLAVKRHELEWRGVLPLSLLFVVGWSALSLLWSEYQWVTLASVLYQVAFGFLGVYVALTRDLIQIVRAVGDVLRVVLGVSLLLEVLAGILLDLPIVFLRISGDIALGGPIQGLLGTRNQLGLVALIALVTFFVELRTRSIPRTLAVSSIILASAMIILSRSPVTFGAVVVVGLAAAALLTLRRVDAPARRISQFVLVGTVGVSGLILYAARGRVIELLNAGSEFEFRYALWRDILTVVNDNTLEGFGWIGLWRRELPPFIGLDRFGAPHDSALNAVLDVWLQLGLVGLCLFILLVGLAIVRTWLLASNKRSVAFVWPALVLASLVVTSAAESSMLVEFGWLLFVVVAVGASQNLSWRARLPED